MYRKIRRLKIAIATLSLLLAGVLGMSFQQASEKKLTVVIASRSYSEVGQLIKKWANEGYSVKSMVCQTIIPKFSSYEHNSNCPVTDAPCAGILFVVMEK